MADEHPGVTSELSLVPEERNKIARLIAYQSWPKDKQFIVKMVFDLIDHIELPETPVQSPLLSLSSSGSMLLPSDTMTIARQYGQETISTKSPILDQNSKQQFEYVNLQEAENVAKEIKRHLQERLNRQLIELPIDPDQVSASTSKKRGHIAFESSINITDEMRRNLHENLVRGLENAGQSHDADETKKLRKKPNLKNSGVQTEKLSKDAKKNKQKVTISESKSKYIDSESSSSSFGSTEDKNTQTHPKDKQD